MVLITVRQFSGYDRIWKSKEYQQDLRKHKYEYKYISLLLGVGENHHNGVV